MALALYAKASHGPLGATHWLWAFICRAAAAQRRRPLRALAAGRRLARCVQAVRPGLTVLRADAKWLRAEAAKACGAGEASGEDLSVSWL